jgi:nucleotide-binding universal stress UspA family protein
MPAHDDKNRIVVGVDGSAAADAALRWAVRQAELTSGSVDAVITWEYPASMAGYGMAPVPDYDDSAFREIAEKTLTEAVSNVVDPASEVRVRLQVVEGNAAEMLLTAARGAGLLVVGSRGHGGFAGALLGSVSQHCVHHAHCPVVVTRGPAAGI